MRKLYTVGYEGLEIEDFCQSLKKKKIQCVADIRKNPISRKRGFSKSRLGEALAAHGIEYIHYRGLGTPTEWRKQEKAEIISRKKLLSDYKKKIIPKHPEEMQALQSLLRKKRTALLCYEADVTDCHRHCVADEIAKREKGEVEIVNLELKPKGLKSLRSSF